jgi:hypothetical protein
MDSTYFSKILSAPTGAEGLPPRAGEVSAEYGGRREGRRADTARGAGGRAEGRGEPESFHLPAGARVCREMLLVRKEPTPGSPGLARRSAPWAALRRPSVLLGKLQREGCFRPADRPVWYQSVGGLGRPRPPWSRRHSGTRRVGGPESLPPPRSRSRQLPQEVPGLPAPAGSPRIRSRHPSGPACLICRKGVCSCQPHSI